MSENSAVARNRICRQCFVYEEAEMAADEMAKHLAFLREEDLASDKVFMERVKTCRNCSYLLGATCNACGCFVEFRANMKKGTCPKKQWKQ